MKLTKNAGTFCALLAAVLYALNAPVSKLLLSHIGPTMMAAFLYLGAGGGMALLRCFRRNRTGEVPLTKADLPYTLGMVALDIAAPVFLMVGLTMTTAANASLLNNFEIAATSLIALLLFREKISGRLWAAIGLVTLSSVLLSLEGEDSFSFSVGSLFVLLACCSWGLENNCTRALSEKDPLEIVVVKGFGSGGGAFVIALVLGEEIPSLPDILAALVLGFVAYGLSIFFYIYAQRVLGAAKTSAYYAVAPFIGTALSLLIFRQIPPAIYWIALVVMIGGTWLATADGTDE
ncbi:MAG: DMT family transporter [Clostridia bacterium]|nr:DMT family transporter [Clostridia bacterium]